MLDLNLEIAPILSPPRIYPFLCMIALRPAMLDPLGWMENALIATLLPIHPAGESGCPCALLCACVLCIPCASHFTTVLLHLCPLQHPRNCILQPIHRGMRLQVRVGYIAYTLYNCTTACAESRAMSVLNLIAAHLRIPCAATWVPAWAQALHGSVRIVGRRIQACAADNSR